MNYLRTFIVVISLVIISCQQRDESENQGLDKSLEELEAEQLSKLTSKDSLDNEIFLGFQYGWTESEFQKHLETLNKQNKLMISNNSLVYEMIIDSVRDFSTLFNYSTKFLINPFYDDNKTRLYLIELTGNSESLEKNWRENFGKTLKIKDLYCKKYGKPVYENSSTKPVDKNSTIQFHWFSGRRIISLFFFSKNNVIQIQYWDLILWNQLKIEMDNERANEIKKTIDEI